MIDKSHIYITNAKPLSFWMAVCVLLFTISGCQNDIPEEVVNDGTIRFATEEVKETKASINSPTDFKDGDAFGVFGQHHKKKQQPKMIFDNTQVSSWGNSWSYENVRRWEIDNIYNFRAFFPYTDQNAGNPALSIKQWIGEKAPLDSCKLSFVVDDEAKIQQDLMISRVYTRDLTKEPVYTPVNFTFRHLLTKVDVKMKLKINKEIMDQQYPPKSDGTDSWRISKFYVKLHGMYTRGDYSSSKKGTVISEKWEKQSSVNKAGYTKWFPETQDPNGYFKNLDPQKPYILIWEQEGGLLMIPQDGLTNVKLEMGVFINYTENDNPTEKQTFVNNIIALPTNPVWGIAQQITYLADFDPLLGLKFTAPKVEPWAISKNSNSVIIQ